MAAAAQAEQQMQQNIDAVNADVGVLCRCSTCNEEVACELAVLLRNENPITGKKNQWRCRLCHNAMGRVRTASKSMSEEQNLGFQNLTLEERRDFYRKAQT